MSELHKKDEVAAVEPKAKRAIKQHKITFHGEGGDVEIAHNFKLNVYKRNVETTIDDHFLAVLKDAVIETTIDGKAVRIPQFSYSVEPI